MSSAMPTLPDECRMTLGVAKMLQQHLDSVSDAWKCVPSANNAIEYKECRAGET
jgi:hypothetical protein